MELRHLRYFVAVAEARSFMGAAARLHVAQPALSKQIRDLEGEVGTVLLERGPRGVRLTAAGRAFLTEARRTLEAASEAIASAREAILEGNPSLRFANGQVAAYGTNLEHLLAAFRTAHPGTRVDIVSLQDGEIFTALREGRVDVGCVFLAEWPVQGFSAHQLIATPMTGVLLPSNHPLAADCTIHLAELRSMSWLHSAALRWPGFFPVLERALRERGLVPEQRLERSSDTAAMNLQIAVGDTWSLASEAVGEPYRKKTNGVVYRPFREPPIPCWLALVWLSAASPLLSGLVQAARDIGLTPPEQPEVPAQTEPGSA